MNLSTTAVNTKKIVTWVVIILVLLLILRVILAIFGGIINAIISNRPPTATNGFGSLSPVSFHSLQLPSGTNPQFTLDTPQGALPNIPSIAYVYPYNNAGANLLAFDNASTIGTGLLFTSSPSKVNTHVYTWNDGARQLTYNLDYSSFDIASNLGTLIQSVSTPSGFQLNGLDSSGTSLTSDFQTYINSILTTSPDYSGGKSSSTPTEIDNSGNISVANNIQSPNSYFLNFFRREKYYPGSNYYAPVYSDNPNISNYNVIITDSAFSFNTSIAQMHYIDIPVGQPQLYNIIPIQTAWNNLINGQGSLMYLGDKNSSIIQSNTTSPVQTFHVQNIYLAYYDSPLNQKYMQPIYVFEGQALSTTGNSLDFSFYVPAL